MSTMPQSLGRRDYFQAPWCYLIWGAPAVMVAAADRAYQASMISPTAMDSLWVGAVTWIGIACFINGLTCGRVHCVIDGVAFPLLSVVGALNVLSDISFSWNLFWTAFGVILAASFVVEFNSGKYLRTGVREGDARMTSC